MNSYKLLLKRNSSCTVLLVSYIERSMITDSRVIVGGAENPRFGKMGMIRKDFLLSVDACWVLCLKSTNT